MGVGPTAFFRRFAPDEWSAARARAWPAAAGTWFYRAWTAEPERRALWLPVGLGAGIALYFAWPSEPALALGLGCAAAGVLLAAACVGLHEMPNSRAALAMAAAVLIGFGAAKLRTETVAAPVLGHKIGPVHFEARIVSADVHGKGTRLLLETSGRIGRLPPARTPRRVRISVRMPPEDLVPGSWVTVLAVLMPPPGPSSPGGYDFGRWAWYQRIGAVGYAYGKAKPIAAARADTFSERWAARIERLRDRMTARIRAVIPGQDGAIAAALITGEEGGIDPDSQNAFRNSGLSHVLSISGLHLALAGGFFFWVLRALLAAIPSIALVYPIKKWSALAALAGAGFYLLISGADSPAVRSYIMLSVMFAGVLFDRPALTMRSVALAAAILLLWQPENLIAPGFEMSFAAVTGLIALAEWESARRAGNPEGFLAPGIASRLRRHVFGVVQASLAAGLASAPFAIFHFDRAPQYGLLSNLLALPVVGLVIMPAATAAMVLMPFGLDEWALIVMGKGVALMLAIAQWVAHLPGAAAMLPAWPDLALLLVTFGGLWFLLWRGRWRWLGAVPVIAGLAAAQLAAPPDILVARNGRDVAVRLADGKLAFLRTPKDDYAAANWLKRDGDARLPDQALAVPSDGVRCDADGCVARLAGGLTLASALRFDALRDDCANADIVVSAVPTRHRCGLPRLVIDRFDIAKNGAYAIRLGIPLDIQTARETRGRRPWSEIPERRRRTFASKYPGRSRRFSSGG